MSGIKEKPILTLLIFMGADNNLDSSALKDLESIKKSSYHSDINIIIQLDRWKFVDVKESYRYHIKNGEEKIIKTLEEFNSGDPEILKSFIEESASEYPSDKLMVVIWSHGSGIDDIDVYSGSSSVSRERFFVKEPKIEEIGISYDDEANDFLDNIELKKALETNVKIDLLGFDACLMGMFEIAYQLKDQAGIIVSSQYLAPSTGWPYELILEKIKFNECTTAEMAKNIVNLYADFYDGKKVNVTQSAYNSKVIKDAAVRFDEFAQMLRSYLYDKKDLQHILSRTESFSRRDYIDLIHFVKLAKEEYSIDVDDLLKSLDTMILHNIALGNGMYNVYGVSIYFPQNNPFKETFEMYLKLDFSQECPHWADLIRWYHS